jgi:hypothetical protein
MKEVAHADEVRGAFWRADNDVFPDETVAKAFVAVPDVVRHRIGSFVARKRVEQTWEMGDLSWEVFLVRGPLTRDLYVTHVDKSCGGDWYFIFVYDRLENRISATPAMISVKWTHASLEKPMISFDDLDEDGEPEVVVEECVHNGTAYDAVVHHYFAVQNDLSLKRILAVETWLHDLRSPNEDGVIHRRIVTRNRNEIVVACELESPIGSKSTAILGEVHLRRSRGAGPFAVLEKCVHRMAYASILVTGSGKEENAFLMEGYGFYY